MPSASTVRTAEAIAVSVHSRYCPKEVNREIYTRLTTWWSDTCSRNIVRSIFSRERQLKMPACGAAAAKGKSKVKEKETVEIAYSGQHKFTALEEISVL